MQNRVNNQIAILKSDEVIEYVVSDEQNQLEFKELYSSVEKNIFKRILSKVGIRLIISPWNYPFQLALLPLISSISAGNTAVLKPSEHSPYTSKLIEEIIFKLFVHIF